MKGIRNLGSCCTHKQLGTRFLGPGEGGWGGGDMYDVDEPYGLARVKKLGGWETLWDFFYGRRLFGGFSLRGTFRGICIIFFSAGVLNFLFSPSVNFR